MVTQMTEEQQQTTDETRTEESYGPPDPAGFWLRVWAYLVDYSILALPTVAITYIFSRDALDWIWGLNPATPIDGRMIKPIVTSLSTLGWFLIIGLFYYPLFESSGLQATPGKLVFRILVGHRDGSPLTLFQALVRHLARAAAIVPIIVGSIAGVILTFAGIGALASACILVGAFFSTVLSVIQYPLAAFTVDKRALHDLIANTYVLRRGEMEMPEVAVKAVLGTAISFCVALLVDNIESSVSPRLTTRASALRDEELERLAKQLPESSRQNASSPTGGLPVRERPTPKPINTPPNFSRVNLAKVLIPPGGKHQLSFPSSRGYTIGFDAVDGSEALASRCANGCIEISGDGKAITTASGGIYVNPIMRRVDVVFKNLENFPIELLMYREIPVPQ